MPKAHTCHSKEQLAPIFMAFFGMGLIFATWASRIPDIKLALDLTEAELGRQLMALPVGQLLMMPLSGWMVARFGSHQTATFGQIGYALALVVLGFVNQKIPLALALFALGALGNLSSISCNTQGVLMEKHLLKPLMPSFHGFWSLAGLSGALFGLILMNLNVTRPTHFIIVSAAVILAALWWRSRLLVTSSEIVRHKGFHLPHTKILPLAGIGFCSMASEGAMFDWSGVYFREVVHAPIHLTLLGYTAFMLCMTLGRFSGNRILTHLGQIPALKRSGLLITIGLLLAVAKPKLFPATIAFMVVGLAVSIIIPTVYSLAAQGSNADPGIVIASVASISYLGFLVAPPMIGAIASALSLRISYTVIAVLGLAITGIAHFCLDQSKKLVPLKP